MISEPVLMDVQDHIATITMNRPDAMNAFDTAMFAGLARAFRRVQDDDDIVVAILTGAGPRAFCAGLDLKERVEGGEAGLNFPDIAPLTNPFWPAPRTTMTKPVIAAVNGYAMGGGFYLALQADLCVAAEHAQFEISEILRGCVAGWETGYLHGLPVTAWAEIAYGGRLSAKRAYDVGLVNEVVGADELVDAARRRAEGIVRVAPLVLRRNHELLHALKPTVGADLWALEAKYIEECRHDPDAAEAVQAFIERRRPRWAGATA